MLSHRASAKTQSVGWKHATLRVAFFGVPPASSIALTGGFTPLCGHLMADRRGKRDHDPRGFEK